MKYTRKAGRILNCQYGNLWPLNLYKSGFVVMITESTYVHTFCKDTATKVSQGV